MNPIVLLAAVVGVLLLYRKSVPVPTTTTAGTAGDGALLATTPKPPKTISAEPLTQSPPVVQMSPQAASTMPPYVYAGVPGSPTLGAFESEAPRME